MRARSDKTEIRRLRTALCNARRSFESVPQPPFIVDPDGERSDLAAEARSAMREIDALLAPKRPRRKS